MVKTLKILLLQNQKGDDLETWYAVLGAWLYQVCSNDNPGLTWTYFMARSNLVPYAFVWEKGKTIDFSKTIVICDLKLATDDWSDKNFLLTSKFCPRGAVCPYMWTLPDHPGASRKCIPTPALPGVRQNLLDVKIQKKKKFFFFFFFFPDHHFCALCMVITVTYCWKAINS